MITIQINEVKKMMALCLLQSTFDDYFMVEAQIAAHIRLSLDGNLCGEDQEKGFVPWQTTREFIYSFIKGKQTPQSMKILWYAPQRIVDQLLELEPNYTPEEVKGFVLRLQFENNKCYLISGMSLNSFRLDKELESLWDQYVLEFMRSQQIDYDVMG